MSKGLPPISLVVEWSPRSVTVFDGQSNTTRSAASLSELQGLSGRDAIAAVSRRAVFVRATRVPNAGVDEVRAIIQLKIGDLFPIATSDLAFDFVLTEDVTSEGRMAIVAAMPSSELKRLLDDSKSAGLRIKRVVPAAFGSAALAHTIGRKDAAVVQPVEGGLAIDIIADGFVRASRLVPTTLHPAAEVSRAYSMIPGQPCAPMISAGGLALDEADMRTKETSLSALTQISPDSLLVNLQPPEQLAQRAKSERDFKLRLASLVAVVSVLFFAYSFMERSDAAKSVDVLQRKTNGKLTDLKKKQKTAVDAEMKVAATEKQLEQAFTPAQTIHEMIATVSNSVTSDVWLTGITAERGKPILIRGTSKSTDAVYAYMDNLKKSDRLRDVQLVFANTAAIELKPVVNFSLSAFPIGNLPLSDPTKKTQ